MKPGDLVLLVPNVKPKKLHPRLLGPYKVLQLTELTAEVQALAFPDKIETVHRDRLIPFNIGSNVEEDLALWSALDKDEYIVSRIVGHTGSTKRNLKFEVEWEGYDGTSEEPLKNFPKGNEVLQNYIASFPDLKKLFK